MPAARQARPTVRARPTTGSTALAGAIESPTGADRLSPLRAGPPALREGHDSASEWR